MSVHFEYIGENNKVVIDDQKSRLVVSRVITLEDCVSLSVGYNTYWSPDQIIQTYQLSDLNEDELIIAIRPKNTNDEVSFNFQWHPAYSSVCTITVHGFDESKMPLAKDVYIYIYSLKPISDDKFGMEIFNENGERIFHSSDALLNILSTELIPESVDVYGNGLVNHPNYVFETKNKKVAMATLAPWSNFEVQIYGFFNVAFIVYYVTAYWTNDGTIKFSAQGLPDIYTYGESAVAVWNAFYATSPFSHFMLIDVTNVPTPI